MRTSYPLQRTRQTRILATSGSEPWRPQKRGNCWLLAGCSWCARGPREGPTSCLRRLHAGYRYSRPGSTVRWVCWARTTRGFSRWGMRLAWQTNCNAQRKTRISSAICASGASSSRPRSREWRNSMRGRGSCGSSILADPGAAVGDALFLVLSDCILPQMAQAPAP